MSNGGYWTNGMSDFSGAFTGLERIPVDTNSAGGVVPQEAALSPVLIGNMGKGARVTKTFAATTTIDLSAGSIQAVTLTAGVTFVFSNPSPGQTLLLEITQGGSGSYTATWPATVEWPASTAPTLTTTAGRTDVIEFTYDATAGVYFGRTYGLNYTL